MIRPFATVSSYSAMLNKVASFTLIAALFAIIYLRKVVPEIDGVLMPYSVAGSLLGFSIPIGTILPAVGFAGLARSFKLHDRISDLFGIRARFDVSEILLPLAVQAKAPIEPSAIAKNRSELMTTTFYAFASSSPGSSSIPVHYVTMALDQWSWYWIVTEATVVILITAIVCAAFKHFAASSILLGMILLLLWILHGIRILCARIASDEVRQIMSDTTRKQSIWKAFDALSRKGT